ncbi:tetratricopeptide repeat-containing sensor histidine kinase [Tenacibaculum ovolyticum]|uniref:tetratricopeptide repeat-containing sensor histidine kinase n=1 Tax=Tenacibaculum ovolyticum TaxID=104270 RepID=UPI001F2AD059|nr:tetratricopeptide repeat-containing sensor histidine kinase [Tenacibaculum ovolyticum]
MKYFKFFFLILILFSFNAYNQNNETDLECFYSKIDSIILKSKGKNNVFKKLVDFHKKKQFDSSYVYSGKLLINSKGELNHLLNYIQGVGALNKNMFKKALENFMNIPNQTNFNNLKLLKLGFCYLSLKEYDKSIYFYTKWEENNRTTDLRLKKEAYHDLALCYIHKKKYIFAKQYFGKELSLIHSNDTLALVRAKMDLANVYYNQYLDSEAIPLFKEAYDLSKVFSNIELKQYTAKNMAVVERNRKRYKESVGYYREFIKWKDSIWSRDRIWELTEKDKKIAVAHKQQKIAVQDEQIKRQKVVQKGLLFGASGLLVFLGGLAFFYRKLQSKNKLITEQKEALNVANNTKNYLFSVVSHDLRSPINSIKRQHQKLAKHIANNDLPAIKEATKSAIAVTESTSHLLNNVLHWSLEQSNMLNFSEEEHALQPVIEQVLFDYENLAEAKAISITSELDNEIIVLTDKESLKIVIRNLIDNSIKYMDGSGSISVKTEKHSETQARIEIKDSGIGISEEKLQKINALKDLSIDKIDRSKGIGLGLLLCQTLIKKNNGTLFFKSEEGTSTTALILLPLA